MGKEKETAKKIFYAVFISLSLLTLILLSGRLFTVRKIYTNARPNDMQGIPLLSNSLWIALFINCWITFTITYPGVHKNIFMFVLF